jgi:hypothetical protein
MSTSSGRYQSSLFSFFSQQSLRFKDKAQQVWRKAKTAAVWGAQIALYPIYLLFQSGRLVGKQMGNAARQFLQLGAGQPEIPPSDTPIQKALVEATQWLVKVSGAVAIQGIASRLSDRGLVLVTVDSQILDLLTLEQQTELQRRIIWEMAIHWRQHRIECLEGQGGRFLPLPQEQPQALPPVRMFQQLMAWMQQSPVAIATNLFQESRLMLSAAEPSIDDLDIHNLQTSPNYFPVFQWIKNQSTDLSQMMNKLLNSSLVLYDPIAPVEPEPDLPPLPELTIEEFFSGEFIGVAAPVSAPVERVIMPTVQPPVALKPTVKTSLTRKPVARKPKVVEETTMAQESALVKPLEARIAPPDAPPTSTLEAEVQVVGYEKHPLEQLLAWLDGGMLWLEQKLGEIWRWLRQR